MTEKLVSLLPPLATALLYGARARARKRRLTFSLTAHDIERMWVANKGRCAVSGIPFNEKRFEKALVKHPFHPSLDRIRPQGGYTPANTRLVCVAANFGMNEWGLDVLAEIAEGVIETRRKRAADEPTSPRTADQEWIADQQRKIDAAEHVAVGLSGEKLRKQRHRIAALKRNRTLGQEGLARAGDKAALVRQKAEQEWIDLRRRLIEQAEEVARGLMGPEQVKQRRHLAALKRNLTLGRTGLAHTGRHAAITRKARNETKTVSDP
jgi:hypothetical protein